MKFPFTITTTNATTLDELVERLAARDVVEGILLMGTTGTGALTPTSDYDILLALASLMAPIGMVTTWVDGRFTEVYCTTVRALERIAATPMKWPDTSEEGTIIRWLQTGRVVHDRAGRLTDARAAVGDVVLPLPTERDVFGAWAAVGYNLTVADRYLASDDPTAQEAVDWRLLYGLFQVVSSYFIARQLPWRGEKAAIRFLVREDPAFLDHFRRCLAETDRRRKVEQYKELAHLALAPLGGPRRTAAVVASPGPGFGETDKAEVVGTPESALAFWQHLLGATDKLD